MHVVPPHSATFRGEKPAARTSLVTLYIRCCTPSITRPKCFPPPLPQLKSDMENFRMHFPLFISWHVSASALLYILCTPAPFFRDTCDKCPFLQIKYFQILKEKLLPVTFIYAFGRFTFVFSAKSFIFNHFHLNWICVFSLQILSLARGCLLRILIIKKKKKKRK